MREDLLPALCFNGAEARACGSARGIFYDVATRAASFSNGFTGDPQSRCENFVLVT